MDKILVEIFIPAANKSYDVYIPLRIKIYEVIMLLSGTLSELLEGYIIASDDTVLCKKETGEILNINMSAEELGLNNGTKLMLI